MKTHSNQPTIFKTFFRLVAYMYSKNRFKVLMMFLSILLTVAVEIYFANIIGTLIDQYIMPMLEGNSNDFRQIIIFLIFSAMILGFGVLLTFITTRLGAVISQNTLVNLRMDLFSHMQDLPISYFDSHDKGMIMGLYTNDLDTLVDVISVSIPQSFSMIVNIISVFIVMLTKNLVLSLFVVGYIIIVLVITRVLSKRSSFYFRKMQGQLGKYTGFVEESMYSAKVIKVFSHEKRTLDDFYNLSEDMRKSGFNATRISNIYMPLFMNIGNLLYVIIVCFGINMIIGRAPNLTLGVLVTFMQLVKAFTGPFAQVSQHLNSIIRGTAGANRIWNFFDTKIEEDEGKTELFYSDKNKKYFWKSQIRKPFLTEVEGKIEFKNVSFSYNGKDRVLKNINIVMEPGVKLAIVGSTGSGKTTITNLLNRFYDIDEGVIEIDGIDIRTIKKSSLRSAISLVLQDTHLFSGTIGENIKFGKLDARDDDIKNAAKVACADDFILNLKDDYNTYISGTESSLSQGERQLLNIARAYIASQPILVMDEATSSVDSMSEYKIQKAIDSLTEKKTVLMIAHRLSTIENADKILVLEKGEIIEEGTSSELLLKKGRYYQLYTGQAELD